MKSVFFLKKFAREKNNLTTRAEFRRTSRLTILSCVTLKYGTYRKRTLRYSFHMLRSKPPALTTLRWFLKPRCNELSGPWRYSTVASSIQDSRCVRDSRNHLKLEFFRFKWKCHHGSFRISWRGTMSQNFESSSLSDWKTPSQPEKTKSEQDFLKAMKCCHVQYLGSLETFPYWLVIVLYICFVIYNLSIVAKSILLPTRS